MSVAVGVFVDVCVCFCTHVHDYCMAYPTALLTPPDFFKYLARRQARH